MDVGSGWFGSALSRSEGSRAGGAATEFRVCALCRCGSVAVRRTKAVPLGCVGAEVLLSAAVMCVSPMEGRHCSEKRNALE